MNLYSIEVKKYKTTFFAVQLCNLAATAVSFILIKKGILILSEFNISPKITTPVMFVMLLLAVFHSQYQRKQLRRLNAIEDFELRVESYEKFYRLRMLWFLLSCMVSCFLTVVTGQKLFLYFAAFDILLALPYYPNLSMFKRELNNDEIMLF